MNTEENSMEHGARSTEHGFYTQHPKSSVILFSVKIRGQKNEGIK